MDSNWLSLSIQGLREVGTEIVEKENLSYFTFELADIVNKNGHRSIFKGTLFRDITIQDSNFTRCDFEGAAFENVVIRNVKFDSADLRACSFSNCIIIDTSMEDTHIHEIVATKTNWINVTFFSASITRSKFLECKFEKTLFEKSTNFLNSYLQSVFYETGFLNCTFSLSILQQCLFESFKIKAESLGFTFGLTWENIKAIDVYFKYERLDIVDRDEFIKFIVAKFLKRKWLYSALLTRLNFDNKSNVAKLNDFSDGIFLLTSHGIFINSEEIQFTGIILQTLADYEELPLASLSYFLKGIKEVRFEKESDAEKIFRQQLSTLYAKMVLLLETKKSDFYQKNINILSQIDDTKTIDIEIFFKEKPSILPDVLFNQLSDNAKCDHIKTEIISEEFGSWKVRLATAFVSLAIFQSFIQQINGSLYTLTVMRARSEILFSETLPEEFRQKAFLPPAEKNEDLDKIFESVNKYIMETFDIDNFKLSGYGKNNIKKIILHKLKQS